MYLLITVNINFYSKTKFITTFIAAIIDNLAL